MNVALMGGTGRTGHLVLAELRSRGHSVTVLVRDPNKLRDPDPAVPVVVGSSTDHAAIAGLLDGAGAEQSPTPIAIGLRNRLQP